MKSLESTYKEIIHIDLKDLEAELSRIFAAKNVSKVLEVFFSQLNEYEYKNILKYKIINAEDFRYLLLTNMT
jgi:hypothetical protein